MSKLTRKEVEEIALLARLHLEPPENPRKTANRQHTMDRYSMEILVGFKGSMYTQLGVNTLLHRCQISLG
jgi:hypothetical protein